jgi:hypothetical protein
MKRQIRRSIFETNSSSTHAIAIINDDDFQKWERGEVYGRIRSEKGSMDNKLYYLEFSSDKEACEKENSEKLQKLTNFYVKLLEGGYFKDHRRTEEELKVWQEDPLRAVKKYREGIILNDLWGTLEDFNEFFAFGDQVYDETQGIHVYYNYSS